MAAPAAPVGRLPLVVYMLAVGTFLMLTTEFVVAGRLPEIAGDLHVSVARAGLLITVFAAGMIVGSPTMAMLTRRMPRRLTLVIALTVFAAGHVVVALGVGAGTDAARRGDTVRPGVRLAGPRPGAQWWRKASVRGRTAAVAGRRARGSAAATSR